MHSRLAALPDEAEPPQRARFVAALTVGIEIIHLRRIARQLGSSSELETAPQAFALGNSPAAIVGLAEFDRRLASLAESNQQGPLLVRARGRILAISDAIVQHGDYVQLKFFEINLLGVYIAPISLLLVAAWFVTVRLRLIHPPRAGNDKTQSVGDVGVRCAHIARMPSYQDRIRPGLVD